MQVEKEPLPSILLTAGFRVRSARDRKENAGTSGF
jgi:hypothetical protein